MSAAHKPGLEIKNISAAYGKKKILNGLTLPTFEKGSVITLVGPNGAGKSTLLRVIAGLHKASGTITFEALDLLALSPKQKAQYLSFMPQMVPSDVGLSVIDAVISALKASPFDPLDDTNESTYQRAMRALNRIGIAHLALQSLDQLSGGQRQLASLARTIVREPALILLDEPTSALDLKHQVTVMRLVHSFAQEGKLVIMVVHDLNMALRWSDQIVVLHEGRLVVAEEPSKALNATVINEVYGVSTRMEACSKGYWQVIVD